MISEKKAQLSKFLNNLMAFLKINRILHSVL